MSMQSKTKQFRQFDKKGSSEEKGKSVSGQFP